MKLSDCFDREIREFFSSQDDIKEDESPTELIEFAV